MTQPLPRAQELLVGIINVVGELHRGLCGYDRMDEREWAELRMQMFTLETALHEYRICQRR